MAKKTEKKAAQEPIEAVSKSEDFMKKNGKLIIGLLVALILIIGGYLAYKHLYANPRAEKAATAIASSEQLFNSEQYEKALKGDSIAMNGILNVAEEYSGTPTGNVANLYAGLCYAHMEKWNEAVDYLKKYNAGDDMFISPMASFALGQAYANLKQYDDAVAAFKNAATLGDKAVGNGVNNTVSPNALLSAGIILLDQKKKSEALDLFKQIKEKYVLNPLNNEIDKYIELATE